MELKQLMASKSSATLPDLEEVITQTYSLFRNSYIRADIKFISYRWSLSDERFEMG